MPGDLWRSCAGGRRTWRLLRKITRCPTPRGEVPCRQGLLSDYLHDRRNPCGQKVFQRQQEGRERRQRTLSLRRHPLAGASRSKVFFWPEKLPFGRLFLGQEEADSCSGGLDCRPPSVILRLLEGLFFAISGKGSPLPSDWQARLNLEEVCEISRRAAQERKQSHGQRL
jgi:hypothetical protein